MSHITMIEIDMMSRERISQAAKNMGYTIINQEKEVIAYNSDKINVDMYLSEKPTIGFKKKDGAWSVAGEFYNSGVDEDEFVERLTSEYTYETIVEELGFNGLAITDETREGAAIALTVSEGW